MNPEQEFEALRGRRDRAFRALETALTKNVLDWGFASKALLPPQEHTSDGAAFLRAALKREAWGPSNGDSLRGVFVAWNLKKPARLIEEFLAQHPPEKYKAAEEAYLAWYEIKVELEREEKRRPPTRSWIGSGGETIPDETHMAAYLLKQLVPIPTPPAGWTIGIMCDGEACTKAPTRWLPSNKQGAAVRAACASLRCVTTAALKSDLYRSARLPCGVKGCRNSHVYEFKCAADGCAKVVRSCCTGHTGEALSAHLPHPQPEERCSVESCFERSTRSEPCASCGAAKRKCDAHGFTVSAHRCADIEVERRCACYAKGCRRLWDVRVECPLGCGSGERVCGVHARIDAKASDSGLPFWSHREFCPEAAVTIKRKELKRITDLAEKAVGDGRWLCVVCQDAARSYAATPCSHLFGCGPCSQKLAKCPICRKAIEGFIPVYLS